MKRTREEERAALAAFAIAGGVWAGIPVAGYLSPKRSQEFVAHAYGRGSLRVPNLAARLGNRSYMVAVVGPLCGATPWSSVVNPDVPKRPRCKRCEAVVLSGRFIRSAG